MAIGCRAISAFELNASYTVVAIDETAPCVLDGPDEDACGLGLAWASSGDNRIFHILPPTVNGAPWPDCLGLF